MQRRRRMRGQRNREGVAQRADLQEAGDARAARRIGLQHIHRARFEHAAEIEDVVAVLASRDLHPRG